MAPGETRFVAKVYKAGSRRSTDVWGVYDHERGCWPSRTAELGVVEQRTDHDTAVREAERLEELVKK